MREPLWISTWIAPCKTVYSICLYPSTGMGQQESIPATEVGSACISIAMKGTWVYTRLISNVGE
jgi:hypothetical protein